MKKRRIDINAMLPSKDDLDLLHNRLQGINPHPQWIRILKSLVSSCAPVNYPWTDFASSVDLISAIPFGDSLFLKLLDNDALYLQVNHQQKMVLDSDSSHQST